MSRRDDFLCLVQTACIVQDVTTIILMRPKVRDGLEVLARALQIDSFALPDNVAEAARDFVVYAYSRPEDGGPPAWYAEWFEVTGGEW